MKTTYFMNLLAFIMIVSVLPFAAADVREEPVAVFLVLDKSLSMVEEIDSVREYVNASIIDGFLITGDFFMLIQFYGEAKPLMRTEITGGGHKEELKRQVSTILADGSFTDIGNALDTLEGALEGYEDDGRRTYLLLLTDGIQEAPPWSDYYSEDGSFNHAFLEHTKTIQKKGWKIQILGIGDKTAAEAVAKELSGGYREIPADPAAEDIEKAARDIFGIVELSAASLSPLKSDGSCVMNLQLAASGYNEPFEIFLSDVTASIDGGMPVDVHISPTHIRPDLEGESTVEVPLTFQGGREAVPEDAEITFRFIFSGEEVFVPSFTVLRADYAGYFSEHLLTILLIAAALALLAGLAVVLLRKRGSGVIRFTCTIEDGAETTKQMVLKRGKSCYIVLSSGRLTLSKVKIGSAGAEVSAEAGALRLHILDPEGFKPLGKVPDNLFSSHLRVRKEDGTYGNITFSGPETASRRS